MIDIAAGEFLKHVANLRGKALYPGLPFFSVPLVILWLISTQFDSSLLYGSGGDISAVSFLGTLGQDGRVSNREGTLMIVPTGTGRFVLTKEQGREQVQLRFPATSKTLNWNQKRIELRRDGVVLDNRGWVGVEYPLMLLVDGTLSKSVVMEGEAEPRRLARLRLNTPESVWIALGALVAAIFSIGLAAGFMKDSV